MTINLCKIYWIEGKKCEKSIIDFNQYLFKKNKNVRHEGGNQAVITLSYYFLYIL